MYDAQSAGLGHLRYRMFDWKKFLLFYIGVPVLLAILAGLSQSGSITFVSRSHHIVYAIMAYVPIWLLSGLCCTALSELFQEQMLPPILLLFAGFAIAANIYAPFGDLRFQFMEPFVVDRGASDINRWPFRYDDFAYVKEAFFGWGLGSLYWIAANLIFLKIFGGNRMGYQADDALLQLKGSLGGQKELGSLQSEESAQEFDRASLLLDEIPSNLGNVIVALKAEEHYTRVYTLNGDVLVSIRFRDAISSLQSYNGLQVHRSYWVNKDFVVSTERKGPTYELTMKIGTTIPVSRSFKLRVEDAGLVA